MLVEDVQFLREKGTKQSYVFLVDSKDRDYATNPTPSEYVVEFTEPFYNVIGLEVVEASVPRSMYNVDAYNNRFRFAVHLPSEPWHLLYDAEYSRGTAALSLSATGLLTVDGDAPLVAALAELKADLAGAAAAWSAGAALRLRGTAGGGGDGEYVLSGGAAAIVVSSPARATVQFANASPARAFEASADAKVAVARPGLNAARWVHATVPAGEYTGPTLVNALNAGVLAYAALPDGTPASITASAATAPFDVSNRVRFDCPYPFVLDFNADRERSFGEVVGCDLLASASASSSYSTLSDAHGALASAPRAYHSVDDLGRSGDFATAFAGPRGVLSKAPVVVAQRFTVPFAARQARVSVALALAGAADISARVELWGDSGGQPNAAAVLAGADVVPPGLDGDLSSAETLTVALSPGTPYWLVVLDRDVAPTAAVPSVYVNASRSPNTLLARDAASGAWSAFDVDGLNVQLSALVEVAPAYHRLEPPGIVNLVGERYVTLRCPEIEQHMFRSLAFTKHFMGLGKLRLGVVGYSENRLDYASRVGARECHPIGRLQRLTLRFETGSGMLYDFKGVNHTIVLALTHYEIRGSTHLEKSILNPNYNGDFLAFRYRQDDMQDEPDDDPEADDYADQLPDYDEEVRRRTVANLPEQRRIEDAQALYRLAADHGLNL